MMRLLFFIIFNFVFFFSFATPTQKVCELHVKFEKAYFFDRKIQNGIKYYTKRKAYLVAGDYVRIACNQINSNWIFVTFTNRKGVVTRGYVNLAEFDVVRL